MCSGVHRLKGWGVACLVSAVKGAGSFLSPFLHTLKQTLSQDLPPMSHRATQILELKAGSRFAAPPHHTHCPSQFTDWREVCVFGPKPVWAILLNISKVSAVSY